VSHFIEVTINDMKQGRETWRVRLIVLIPTLMIALGFALARVP